MQGGRGNPWLRGPGKHGTPVTAETPDHAWHAAAGRHPVGTGARRGARGADRTRPSSAGMTTGPRRARTAAGLKRASSWPGKTRRNPRHPPGPGRRGLPVLFVGISLPVPPARCGRCARLRARARYGALDYAIGLAVAGSATAGSATAGSATAGSATAGSRIIRAKPAGLRHSEPSAGEHRGFPGPVPGGKKCRWCHSVAVHRAGDASGGAALDQPDSRRDEQR
jgi:hypothetical protein